MKKVIAIVLVAIMALAALTACSGRTSSDNSMTQTPATTTTATVSTTEQATPSVDTSTMTVKEEVDNFWNQQSTLQNKALALLEEVKSMPSMTDDIREQLYAINKQLAELRITTIRTVSDGAYAELKWYIEVYQNAWCDWQYYSDADYYYYPLQSGYGTEFTLKANYFRKVIWADNVKVDASNDDFGVNRTYTVIDTSHDGFVLVESAETQLQLFQIHPND